MLVMAALHAGWLLRLGALGYSAPPPRFTACVPNHFGADCSGTCGCAKHEDCADGITGDGACTCALGFEGLCGPPPPPAGPPSSCPAGQA